jgi:O-antigen/teichoic acid export membrane protein
MGSNVMLNTWLIPRYGATGAAAAALLGNFVLWVGAMIAARGIAQYDGGQLLRSALKTTFAASFMAVSLHLLQPVAPLLVVVLSGVAIYALVLVGVGGATVAEARGLMDVFLRRGDKKISDLMSDQEI